jgi:hypothetical protein
MGMKYLLFLFMLATCLDAAAKIKCPSPKSGRWPAACFTTEGEVRRIKSPYLKRLELGKSGFDVISVEETHEWLAVDRKGVVVIPGIYWTGDFDYPDAEGGVGRFESNGKCGYFKAPAFKVVVPAAYDFCEAFHEGEAGVCTDCRRYCLDQDCHLSTFVGGKGYVFNLKGCLLRRYQPHTLEQACGKAGVAEVRNPDAKVPLLLCKPDPDDPFKMPIRR